MIRPEPRFVAAQQNLVSLCRALTVSTPTPLPRRSRHDNSLKALKKFIADNRAFIDMALEAHGCVRLKMPGGRGSPPAHWYILFISATSAVLFRGWDVRTAQEFEQVGLTLLPNDLSNYYLGTSPRVLLSGCSYVYSASEFPPFYPIPQHVCWRGSV